MIKEGGSGAVESNLDMVIRKVTNGHALTKHLHEFSDPALGPVLDIKDQAGLEKHLRNILNDPETVGMVRNVDGSYMSFYNRRTNTLFHFEPKNVDGGSIYRPKNPQKEFLEEFDKALKDPHSSKIIVEGGGYKALAEKFTGLTGKVPVHRYWGKMSDKLNQLGKIPPHIFRQTKDAVLQALPEESRLARTFNIAAEVSPLIFRRGLKFIPLAGTAVVFLMGEAEADEMRTEAAAAVEAGILPPEALEDYEKIVNAHRLQMNADFSLVGAEGKVQLGFEKFAAAWGLNAHPEWKERLEPVSLVETLTGVELIEVGAEELLALWDKLPMEVSEDMPPEMQALVQYKAGENQVGFAEYYADLKAHDGLYHVLAALPDQQAEQPKALEHEAGAALGEPVLPAASGQSVAAQRYGACAL
ncbi:MAG: hypothetical protein KDJ75_08165 [Alphaproteobacteria bacterium]|nr:hypothetical protein [Alphaproteobacteria bacterium]